MYREKPSHEVMDISYRLLKNHKPRPSIRSPSSFYYARQYTVFFHPWTNINIILKNCHAWSPTSYLTLFPFLAFPSTTVPISSRSIPIYSTLVSIPGFDLWFEFQLKTCTFSKYSWIFNSIVIIRYQINFYDYKFNY